MVTERPHPERPKAAAKGAQAQSGMTMDFGRDTPLPLDCGVTLSPFTLAYQTYGKLDAERSNAILACHALTGDQ